MNQTTKTYTLTAFVESRTSLDDENIAPEDFRLPDIVLEIKDHHVIPGDSDVCPMGDVHDPRWECGFHLQNPRTERNAKLGEFLKAAWKEGRTVSLIAVARDIKSKKPKGFIL